MSVKIDGNGDIVGAASTFSPGDFKWRQAAAPGAGWIAATGGTIGNAGSGATNRANADTLALFTLWWTDYNDATLPIQTVTGAASTRGASAIADWAAGKRLTVFNVSGRFIRAPGTINSLTFVNGNSYATTTQDHQHRTSMGSDNALAYSWLDGANGPVFGSEVTTGARSFNPGGSFSASGSIRVAYTDVMRVASISGESAGPSIVMLPCYKL